MCMTEHEKGIGLGKLIDTSEASGFFLLHRCLLSFPSVVYVHNECRKFFTDRRKIKRRKPEDAAALLRGSRSKGILYWKHVCELASSLLLTHTVHTLEIRDSLLRPFKDKAVCGLSICRLVKDWATHGLDDSQIGQFVEIFT